MPRLKVIGGSLPKAPSRRYKHFTAKTIQLDELVTAPKERKLSPRQKAALEREAEINKALNEAAVLPASAAFVLELADGESIQNYRNAFLRIWQKEPREGLSVAGRGGNTILISRGKLPGKTWRLSGET